MKLQRYDISPITVNDIRIAHVVIRDHYQEKLASIRILHIDRT
jgi:hypothetical protein